MIKTKSVYYDKAEANDGIRILVMRRWPRGISKEKAKVDRWIKELGPSNELLSEWNKSKINFAEYKTRYLKEMQMQTQKIRELAEVAGKNTLTLLCHEKSDAECHRRLLKELIEKA